MAMALCKTNLFSKLRSSSKVVRFSCRVAGTTSISVIVRKLLQLRSVSLCQLQRESSNLLEEDPALKRFKSYKNAVKRVSKIGNGLAILVAAACSYEILRWQRRGRSRAIFSEG